MPASTQIVPVIPAKLFSLENGCGVVSAWMALHHCGKRMAVAELAHQCRLSQVHGTFAIVIAVALKKCGLSVSFHTDQDNDTKRAEDVAYRSASRLQIPVLRALRIDEMRRLLKNGKFIIVLFDTREGDGHFSPVLSIGRRFIRFAHADEPKLRIDVFQKRWSARGICRQAIVVD